MTQPPADRPPTREPASPEGSSGKPKIGLPLILLSLVIFALVVMVMKNVNTDVRTFTDVERVIKAGHVKDAVVSKTSVRVNFKKGVTRGDVELQDPNDEKTLLTEKEAVQPIPESRWWRTEIAGEAFGESIKNTLETAKLEGKIRSISNEPSGDPFGAMFLVYAVPFLLIAGIFWFLMRRMGPPQGVMNFGKSKAKVYAEKEVHVTFDDVAGADEAVEEVREIVEFLQEPKKFQALGARIPKGVLLLGAPGTGKTLLARAVAGEAGVPFFSLSGSDFVEMFVGVGASRVRDLFQQAEAQAPCLVFIDELDALGKTRGSSPISNDEREQTLNALLVEMDGFDANNGVIIIAATNRPEILDPALMRAGRFDRQIVVDRPDVVGRQKILNVHARKVKLDDDVDLKVIARRTPGFVGADLANVVNEAALLAARRDQKTVKLAELEEAIDRVMTGLERRRRGMTDRERVIVAAHETGHAVVGFHSPGTDPVHRISIIPRGVGTGGHTLFLPDEERSLYTRKELIARITALLGGRAAERVVFDHFSTGASNDLEVATRIARHMITRYGMSERVGPVSLESEEPRFLPGSGMTQGGPRLSDETQNAVDDEVRELIEACEERALEILRKERDKLDEIREILIEKEVIEAEEFQQLMNDSGESAAANGHVAPDPKDGPGDGSGDGSEGDTDLAESGDGVSAPSQAAI